MAQHYAEANRAGARQICDWVAELGIACDLESKAAYAYASDSARRDEIAVEAEAARRVGFDAQVLTGRRFLSIPQRPCAFPIRPSSILQNTWSDWHWRWKAGGRIFESTRVTAIDRGGRAVAAADGVLDVEHVVVATNLPFTGPVEYDRSTQPRGHTAMAFRAREEAAIDGMFIAIDEPRCSLRMGRRRGPCWWSSVQASRPGRSAMSPAGFASSTAGCTNLPVDEAVWRWFNEDYDTADRVPFVGAPSGKAPGFYVATGFNAWGISNGTAAGMLIADQILGRSNPWANLYAPARPSPESFNKGASRPPASPASSSSRPAKAASSSTAGRSSPCGRMTTGSRMPYPRPAPTRAAR